LAGKGRETPNEEKNQRGPVERPQHEGLLNSTTNGMTAYELLKSLDIFVLATV